MSRGADGVSSLPAALKVLTVVASLMAGLLGLMAVVQVTHPPYRTADVVFVALAAGYFGAKSARLWRGDAAGGPDRLGTPLGAAALGAFAVASGLHVLFAVLCVAGYLADMRRRFPQTA